MLPKPCSAYARSCSSCLGWTRKLLASMSISWEDLAVRFDRFYGYCRQTGKLHMWIDDAVQGVKDLGRILVQTGQALEELSLGPVWF